ncbi:jacalin-like lectin [Paenibacillus algorifonticola]|uniref:jacalin-like lectin n=1 Tax=Paenibacillus algorifonticola TaxID=684063 RepID=UPI003D2A3900
MRRLRRVCLAVALSASLVVGFVPFGGSAANAAGESGSFSVLSYNVGGLPGFLSSSNPEQFTTQISPLLNDFDIVNVQEDFNYHSQLISAANHPYKTATSGPALIGSGLNMLSKFPFTDLARIKWKEAYGVFDSGSDQLTPKGFTASRHELAPGAYVDVYNLHADADIDPGSMAARASNIRQMYAYINQHSDGNAVIVFGDTNTRYTRELALLQEMTAATGLTDVWVQLVRGGSVPAMGDALIDATNRNGPSNEVVDKIFYRSSPAITLAPTQYRLEDTKFVDAAGNQLSDHFAISTKFNYQLSAQISLSAPFGGSGGEHFNQLAHLPSGQRLTSLSIRSGSRLDGIQLGFASGVVLSAGGTSAAQSSIQLASDEYVKSVVLNQGSRNGGMRIFYAKFTTNKGQVLAGGTTTSDAVTYTAPEGWYIAGFYGKADNEMDRMGVIYKRL